MDTVDAKKLKSIMFARCIGVSALAKLAGVQGSIISRLTKSDRPAQLPTISKICKALGVQPTEILKGDDSVEKV